MKNSIFLESMSPLYNIMNTNWGGKPLKIMFFILFYFNDYVQIDSEFPTKFE